ncbi:MAG: acyl-CoA desaturase [Deltaproteobacteria bacterium]|nr:acyl-CoA desaturase [Deltaproteobacteria bacterium]
MSATTQSSIAPLPLLVEPVLTRPSEASAHPKLPLSRYLIGGWPMWAVHLAALGVVFTGASTGVVVLMLVLWYTRMIAITMGFHRYFSHRSFKTGRVFQFILAVLSQSAGQRGVLWWASHHRRHHKYSDEPEDVHSPRQRGFMFAHVGWFYAPGAMDTDLERVKDLARFPELRFIDKYWYLPVVALGAIVTAIWGLEGFIVGFCGSTVLLWHTTFFVNSLAHVWGTRPYETTDDSRNNFAIALITAGEGWHNNHHHYQSSARQGFRWWQVDVTWYCLKALEAMRIVHDVRAPPEHVVQAAGKRAAS